MASGLSFLISLEEQISGPSSAAATSLEQLSKQIKGEQGSLTDLERMLKHVAATQGVESEQYKNVAGLIDEKKSSLGGLIDQYVKLKESGASSLESLSGATEGAGISTSQLMAGAKGLLGPMGGLFERANMLGQAFKGVNVMAIAAVAAVVMVGVAVVRAAVHLTQFALAAADAARSQRIAFSEMTGSAAGGAALAGAIDRISRSVPQTRAELGKMAEGLAKSGLKGRELEQALEKAALKAAGPFANEKMLSFSTQVDKLHENLSILFEGIDLSGFLAALQDMLSFFSQSTASGRALKWMITEIFGGLASVAAAVLPVVKSAFQSLVIAILQGYIAVQPLIPVMEALAAVVIVAGLAYAAMFIPAAIATAVTAIPAIISGAIAGAAAFGSMAVAVIAATWPFLLFGAVVVGAYMLFKHWASVPGWLKPILQVIGAILLIPFAPFIVAVMAAIYVFRNWEQIKPIVMKVMMAIGAILLLPFAPFIAAVMGAIYVFRNWDKIGAIISSALSSAWGAVTGFLGNIGNGIASGLSAAWAAVTGFVSQFVDAGANIIRGLVDGITSGAGAILSALLAPVQGGINAVKSLLKIQSPSRVFMEIGGHTAAGFAEGVDAGSADVGASVAAMVTPPKPAAGAGAARGASSGSMQVSIAIDARGAGDAGAIRQAVLDAMAEAAERMGMQMGVA